ncbi:MAG TPA: hypothetical protein VEU51_12490 [Candidatus Acidoferrales bacterium]|nr:hypothetical protein [Candidatus Acidoferrales bacterium]
MTPDSPRDSDASPRPESTSQLIRSERSQLAKLARVVRLADFMAILMVFATFFSAYATWRTAQVTSLVYRIVDRPYIGVQQVSFEAVDSARPTVAVNLRNFGSIQALDTIASAVPVVDGKAFVQPGAAMTSIEMGILSPTVPHFLYAYLSPDAYRAVVAGKSNLQVRVRILYKGPARERNFCYLERFAYDPPSASFRASGGSDACGSDVF